MNEDDDEEKSKDRCIDNGFSLLLPYLFKERMVKCNWIKERKSSEARLWE